MKLSSKKKINLPPLDTKFKKFFIKYSVLSSIITFVFARLYIEYVDSLLLCILDPLLSIDLDKNGVPDLEQLKKFKLKIFNITIPIGLLIYKTISFLIKAVLLYYIIIWILNNILL